jgi:uncharacterized cupin superfamily protein
MRQVGPLVYEWSAYQPSRRRNANGHFLQSRAGEPGALVNPVPFQEGDDVHVRDLGGVAAVLVTEPDRAPAAVQARDTFRATLLATSEASAAGAASLPGAEPLTSSSVLPGSLHLVAAGEVVALYHLPSASALLGGAVAGAPAGQLSFQAAEADAPHSETAARLARGLRLLLGHPVRRILVAEGESLHREAERALQDLLFAHDPASFLLRPDELVWQPPRERGTRFSRRSAECSRLLGLRTLDFEVTTVPPGKQSTLMHGHPGYEELFIILEGSGEVQVEGGTFPIGAGDMLGFPARHHVPHAIRNTGEGDLRFLSFGAPPPPDERAGIADYPESNKQVQWLGSGKVRRFYLPEQLDVDYWEGERLD